MPSQPLASRRSLKIASLAAVVGLSLALLAAPAAAQFDADEEATQIPAERPLPCCPTPTELTNYEEIKSCGLYPQEARLECVIEIKQLFGYAGPIGSPASFEHVLFCVDWNGAGGFTQDEVVGEVTLHIHDEGAGGNPPWFYAVYRDVMPPGGPRTSNGGANTTTTTNGPSLQARAILSWFVAPTGCNFVPQWGNVVNFQIRLDPVR
jgi:hypothetical protein